MCSGIPHIRASVIEYVRIVPMQLRRSSMQLRCYKHCYSWLQTYKGTNGPAAVSEQRERLVGGKIQPFK